METALQWLAFATQQSPDDIRNLGLSDDQIITLGSWVQCNHILNPKPAKSKWGVFVCKCGCGEMFAAKYKTKRPQYKNEAHRQRYWRGQQSKKEKRLRGAD